MRYIIIFVSILFLGLQTTYAQKQAKADEELSWKQKLKKADELMAAGSYYNAIEYYEQVLEERPEMGDVALSLGTALYQGRNYKDAVKYFKQAYEADEKKYKEAQFYYGLMLKMNGQYQEAFDQLRDFYRTYRASGKDALELKKRSKVEYEGAEMAIQAMNDTLNVIVTHLGTNVNENYTEFSPRILGDTALLFGSLRVEDVIVLDKEQKKMPRARLYISEKGPNGFSKGEEMPGPFNDTKAHTGNGTYSPDGKRFYFTQCETDKATSVICDIYYSRMNENGEWSSPKPVASNDKKANDSHPYIVPYRSGEIMYFSSDREGGEGGTDIYYAFIYRDGEDVRDPYNLGRRINTPGNEITPFYDEVEEILYYSSDYEPGFGGFDVFKSKGSGRRWAKPLNMQYPINSPVDDMYYVHDKTGEAGYLVSNRDGSLSPKWPNCCDDIWDFRYIVPPRFVIMGYVYEKGDETKTPIDSSNVQLFISERNALIDSAVSETEERYNFDLGAQKANYRLEARKEGYLSGVNTTSTVGLTSSDTLFVDLYLTPIESFGKIVLRNVYFDLDKAFIREDAKPSLDTIYHILRQNPNIQIELSSHTDSRASKAYNMELSQRRADSSKAYLVEKGIDPERIVAKGYGESQLLNNCADGVPCTDIEHQLNRRTEFQIIGEIPGTIVTYDKSEIENVRKKKEEGTLQGTEDVWEFEEEEPQP